MSAAGEDPLGPLRASGLYGDWCEVAARFGDQDPNRHINNTAICQYVEEARVSLRRRLVGGPAPDAGVAYAVASFRIRFLSPIRYPCAVRIGTAATRIGRTSYTLVHGVHLGAGLVALARTVTVTCRPQDGAPVPIPEALATALAPLLRESPEVAAASERI